MALGDISGVVSLDVLGQPVQVRLWSLDEIDDWRAKANASPDDSVGHVLAMVCDSVVSEALTPELCRRLPVNVLGALSQAVVRAQGVGPTAAEDAKKN